MISCLIVAENKLRVTSLKQYIFKLPFLNLIDIASDQETAGKLIYKHGVNVVFVNFQMLEDQQLQFIRGLRRKCEIVIISDNPDDAIKAFELDALDFLSTNFSYERFCKTAAKARSIVKNRVKTAEPNFDDFIIFKGDMNLFVKIEIQDIEYIEGMGNYTAIYTNNQKHLPLISMKDIEEKLIQHKFIRIHRSFIIPMSKVALIHSAYIVLKNSKKRIPIGNTYKTNFSLLIKQRMIL